eukprot:scaffold11332_cov65-Phaeocystis_antarctica.AAC.7
MDPRIPAFPLVSVGRRERNWARRLITFTGPGLTDPLRRFSALPSRSVPADRCAEEKKQPSWVGNPDRPTSSTG